MLATLAGKEKKNETTLGWSRTELVEVKASSLQDLIHPVIDLQAGYMGPESLPRRWRYIPEVLACAAIEEDILGTMGPIVLQEKAHGLEV
jgi:hypothetical protein